MTGEFSPVVLLYLELFLMGKSPLALMGLGAQACDTLIPTVHSEVDETSTRHWNAPVAPHSSLLRILLDPICWIWPFTGSDRVEAWATVSSRDTEVWDSLLPLLQRVGWVGVVFSFPWGRGDFSSTRSLILRYLHTILRCFELRQPSAFKGFFKW